MIISKIRFILFSYLLLSLMKRKKTDMHLLPAVSLYHPAAAILTCCVRSVRRQFCYSAIKMSTEMAPASERNGMLNIWHPSP